MAEALETAGVLDEALVNYTVAVNTAKQVGDQRLEIFKANPARFKKERKRLSAE